MKTLVITGASQGIGYATAALFAENGYRVINLSRKEMPLDGHMHCSLSVDLMDKAALQHAQKTLAKLLSDSSNNQVHLVHNSAIFDGGTALNTTEELWTRSFWLNVTIPALLNQAIHPQQIPGSSIIYVGSTLSEKAIAGAAPYVASKHALAGLMKSTCQDLVGTGIHTALVCPGFTDTEMLRSQIQSKDQLDAIKAMSTMNRLIEPAEMAELIYFAAHNPVINGAVLHGHLGQIEK